MDRVEFSELYEKASAEVDTGYRDRLIEDSLAALPENMTGMANLVIAVEEFSELSQEVSRWIRGKGDTTGLLEEVADVLLAIEYVKRLCGVSDEQVGKAINAKLARLERRNAGEAAYQ